MADSVLDFAGLDAAAGAADASAAAADDAAGLEVDDAAAGVDDAAAAEKNADGSDKVADPEKNADGTDKVKDDDAAAKPVDATPQSVRSTLKSLKDADPKNAKIVNELHGSYERWQAAKQIFPKGVAEMKAAKELIDLVGGAEGYEAAQTTIAAIKASDEKIYSGDGSIHDDIVEDLKAEGKLDKYPALVSAGISKLKEIDTKAYDSLVGQPVLHAELTDANFPGAISSLLQVLTLKADATPEQIKEAVTKAVNVVGSMDKWWKGIDSVQATAKTTKADPERQKLDAERTKFQNEQKEFATKQSKEFQDSVVKEAGVVDRQLLGKSLTPFMKTPYFKSFTKENWQPLANLIQTDLYDTLKADKTYQAQMKAMWASKTPDKGKILEYRRAKVEGLAGEIVRRSVQKMYPEHAKGGAAAGRVAAATAKKVAEDKTNKEQAASGKPVYVAQKPAWDAIDFDKDPKQYLYTAGKAFLKGSGRLVTWRR